MPRITLEEALLGTTIISHPKITSISNIFLK
jgi:hypothetical protein